MSPPRISILVPTWNCAPLLSQFLESLGQQSWTDWELLILDNASQDGSVELVDAFQSSLLSGRQRVLWVSQPDSGIYDAWNRGLRLATGEYLCFVGADDTFNCPDSLAQIARLTITKAHLITARNSYCDRQGRFLRDWGSSWCWKRMRQSMNIAHPGMLVSRALFDQFGLFDVNYRICGDYEWFLRLPSHLRTVHSSDSILRVVQAGVSHTRIATVYAETFNAQKKHIGAVPSAFCWALNWAKYARRRLIGLA